jgi:hypothetical protein
MILFEIPVIFSPLIFGNPIKLLSRFIFTQMFSLYKVSQNNASVFTRLVLHKIIEFSIVIC